LFGIQPVFSGAQGTRIAGTIGCHLAVEIEVSTAIVATQQTVRLQFQLYSIRLN